MYTGIPVPTVDVTFNDTFDNTLLNYYTSVLDLCFVIIKLQIHPSLK